jgi:IS1 family transposase
MNQIPFKKRRQIIHLMVEGNSVRGIARLVDGSPVTVLRQLALAGLACAEFHDEHVKGVKARHIQCDEIWSFNYCKDAKITMAKAPAEKAVSVWTWTAIDADSKLILSYLSGNRDGAHALEFIGDLAERIVDRPQITTDGLGSYVTAIDEIFAIDVDFAQLIKTYSETPDASPERKYSPGICTGTYGKRITGKPDARHVSTSYVETHNQKMRQHMRRFARLTAAYAKKFANHCHMASLYTTWYNFVTINSAVKVSPTMAAGVETRLWEMDDLTRLVEAYENSRTVKL